MHNLCRNLIVVLQNGTTEEVTSEEEEEEDMGEVCVYMRMLSSSSRILAFCCAMAG